MSQTKPGTGGKGGKGGKGEGNRRPAGGRNAPARGATGVKGATGKGKSWQKKQRRSVAPILWGLAVLVGIAAIAAVVITRDDDDPAAKAKQETGTVTVSGAALPKFVVNGKNDTAVGKQAPELRGTGFDGEQRVVPAGDGRPKVIIFLAHWCPHCQAEVPRIVDFLKDGKPQGVDLYSVATGTSTQQPNYPPSAWLAREGWTIPVLADSAEGTAASAYGLSAYPYFVFVGADGKVVKRDSGEISMDSFRAAIEQLAATSAQ